MSDPVLHLLARINGALQSHRFTWANEIEFQDGVDRALELAELGAEREVQLGKAGRVDFFILQGLRGIAIELKVKGARAEVLRQLHRYAEVDRVLSVVLVTPSLRLRTPGELAGKPARTVHLPRFM